MLIVETDNNKVGTTGRECRVVQPTHAPLPPPARQTSQQQEPFTVHCTSRQWINVEAHVLHTVLRERANG